VNVAAELRLKSGRDRPLRFGHPWVFAGAIADLDPSLAAGALVRVRAANGEALGIGYVNPRCTIAVRMLARGDVPIDAAFIGERVARAAALRRHIVAPDTTAYRLINGEGDALPGFVVDRFADVLVVQCLTAGADRLRPLVLEALADAIRPRAIVERSEGAVRRAEGLEGRTEVVLGELSDAATVEITENGARFEVPLGAGQKTGHYCDQRPNRAIVRAHASGRTVLDAFSYTGGFGVHAGLGGAARVVMVDSSRRALDAARANWMRNGLGENAAELVQADARDYLRRTGEQFDLVVLDPPALARQRKDVARGARAYKDLNLWGFKRAAAGALMLTFSCSQHVDRELFRKIVLGAAADAHRAVRLLGHLASGPDHATALAHPEAEYLTGLFLEVS
jgi:23S rRNA (cytosine1962-C5)-methyltransferase